MWSAGERLARPAAEAANAELFEDYSRWIAAATGEVPGFKAPMIQTLVGRISVEHANELRDRLAATALEYLGGGRDDENGVWLSALVVVTPISDSEVLRLGGG